MENSVKLLLSLTVTLLCVRPAPSLLCDVSLESDQFCSIAVTVTAPSDMTCFTATVTGHPEEPFKMVVKGVAARPLCERTFSQKNYHFATGHAPLILGNTCCGTDLCNRDPPSDSKPDVPDFDVLCMPPNPCPDDLLKQLHLLTNGSMFIPTAFCN